jgi:predicted AAA+ superfamily ATPase
MLFSRDDVLRVLHGFNPWWSRRTMTLPTFRRAIYGACRRHLESRSAQFVLLLSGLRGTGKTTMLLQLATDLVAAGAEPKSVLYLGMGHPVFGRLPLTEILELYREIIHAKDRPAILLLDEMHYAREWDLHVKQLLLDESGYRIIATESVQMIERALVTETQFGRWSAMSAPSLSFYEYLTLRGLDVANPATDLDLGKSAPIELPALEAAVGALRPVMTHFRGYLAGGGLPWLASLSDQAGTRSVMHEDVAESILRRDIALHFGARNVEDLKRLFVYICMHSGDIFPVQRYARLVGVSASTVASHLELLERCFLVRRLPPIGSGGGIVHKARYRVFVTDTTLRNAQLLRDADHLTDAEELRRVVATCDVRHIVERYTKSLARVGYWRDSRTRRGVDVVVQDVNGSVVFHGMYDRPATLSEKDGVVQYCRDEKVPKAYLVTREENDLAVFKMPGVDTQFVKVPAHALAYLLGRAECKAATG